MFLKKDKRCIFSCKITKIKSNIRKREIIIATETKSIKFSKATITRDEESGDFIVEEVKKDNIVVTNLTNKLEDYIGMEGLTITIGKTTETVSEE